MATSIIGNSDIITVLRGTKVVDAYNTERVEWDSPTTVAVGRASVQHYLALEEETDRQTETEAGRLFTDTSDMRGKIQAEDRFVYDGRTWEVTSPPEEFRLFGKYHHTEMFVKIVVG